MNKQLLVVIVVALLALGGLGGWWLLNKEDDTAVETTDTSQQMDESTNGASDTQIASFTKENVAEHNTKADCWTIISGKVYDLTSYIPRHQGGDEILRACGTDGTLLFSERKDEAGQNIGTGTPHSTSAVSQLESLLMGDLASETNSSESADPSTSAAQ